MALSWWKFMLPIYFVSNIRHQHWCKLDLFWTLSLASYFLCCQCKRFFWKHLLWIWSKRSTSILKLVFQEKSLWEYSKRIRAESSIFRNLKNCWSINLFLTSMLYLVFPVENRKFLRYFLKSRIVNFEARVLSSRKSRDHIKL